MEVVVSSLHAVRRRSMAYSVRLAIAAVILAAGCDRVAAYRAVQAPTEASIVQIADGSPVADAPLRGDARRTDAAQPDALWPDDGAASDAAAGDAAEDVALSGLDVGPGCTETLKINEQVASCNAQSIKQKPYMPDFDGDGLRDAQDPQPQTCNRLWLQDEFTNAVPAVEWVTGTGVIDWSPCGSAQLSAGSNIWVAAASAQNLQDVSYLVEARFKLGTPAPATDWSVRITLGAGDTPRYTCELWVCNPCGAGRDAQYLQPQPGIRHSRVGTGTCFDFSLRSGAAGNAAFGSPGSTYILQTWHTGTAARCRLLDGYGTVIHALSTYYSNCPLPQPGTVAVLTRNVSIDVDYLRVFDI